MAEAGLEGSSKYSGKTGVSERGGAESGARDAQTGPIDDDLAELIAAWPGLPNDVKADVLAMVKASR